MFWFYPNMQILNQNNNIKFTSTPLYHVNLKRVGNNADGFERAIISKLNPYDKIDDSAIKNIRNHLIHNEMYERQHCVGTDFCEEFEDHFLDMANFNAIELINNEELSKKIIGLVSFYKNLSGKMRLKLLFTMPNCQNANQKRKIKGIGEIALGNVFNQAKELNAKEITIDSSNSAVKFYEKTFKKAGINPKLQKGQSFIIKNNDFEKYLNYIKNEYKIDFSQKIQSGIVV